MMEGPMLALNVPLKSDRKTDFVNAQSEKKSDSRAKLRSPVRVDRVRQRIDALKTNPAAVARMAGLERTYVADLLEGKKKSLRTVYLRMLAAALDCSPAYLRGTDDELRGPGTTVPEEEIEGFRVKRTDENLSLLGTVETGAFRTTRGKRVRIAVPPDRNHITARQAAFKVAGEDLIPIGMPPETILVGVNAEDWVEKVGNLKSGQMVILATETTSIPGFELSLRRVEVFGSRIELRSPAAQGGGIRISIEDNELSSRAEGWTFRILFVVTRTTQILD